MLDYRRTGLQVACGGKGDTFVSKVLKFIFALSINSPEGGTNSSINGQKLLESGVDGTTSANPVRDRMV